MGGMVKLSHVVPDNASSLHDMFSWQNADSTECCVVAVRRWSWCCWWHCCGRRCGPCQVYGC
jgi:hypothetical protein